MKLARDVRPSCGSPYILGRTVATITMILMELVFKKKWNFMKYAFWVTLAIFGTQSAQAGVTIPYKKISIDCSGLSQSLQLQWNFSKSPMMYRLLVNGKNEIGGTQMTYENGSSNYSKPNVFSIILNTEDDKAQFSKTVTISNETIPMICTQSSSWHVVESD